MEDLPELSEMSSLNLQLEDRLSIQLETVHSQNDAKSEDPEVSSKVFTVILSASRPDPTAISILFHNNRLTTLYHQSH